MKLVVALITYNRKEYSQRTLKDFFLTVKVPYHLVIIDNNSTDGTQQWLTTDLPLRKENITVILNPENYYPGKACNIAWQEGLKKFPEATHLMRLDNDMHLEDGWDSVVENYFETIPELGQVGLDHSAIENPDAEKAEQTFNGLGLNPWPGNVGGPNVISRAVWDKGLRYDETRWQHFGTDKPTPQEDCKFSMAIQQAGFLMGHITEKIAWTFANQENWNEYPEYYKKTMSERGYRNQFSHLWEDE